MASGYATYRLRVNTGNRHHGTLGLRIGFVRSAYRLYVNGEQVHQAGKPGTSAAATVPLFSDDIVPLPPAKDGYEIVVHVANYHFPTGGIIGSVLIGIHSRLDLSLRMDNLITIVRASILLLLGLYQLLIFSLQRTERQYLFLGLICFCFIPEISGTNRNFWSSVIPFLTWSRAYSWSHIAYCSGCVFFIAYLRRLFPMDLPRYLARAAIILNSALAVVIAIIPAEYMRYMLLPFHLMAAMMLAISAFVLFRSAVIRQEKVLFVQLGVAVLLLSAIFDIMLPLLFRVIVPLGIPAVSLLPGGTLIMCALQVIGMTREFISTTHHAAQLAMDNEALKALLGRRIKSDPRGMTDSVEVKNRCRSLVSA